MSPTKPPPSTRAPLFWIALPVFAAVGAWSVLAPDGFARAATAITRTAFRSLDWFYLSAVTAFLVVCLWLAFGKHGGVRLGRADEPPEFSTRSWLAMLFAAGMGVGLLFWGAAEPISHFTSPPVGEAETPQAARQALVLTTFHWGLHAWAVYGIGGLVLAYFGFRHRTPYLAGAPIRRAFAGRWVAPVAWLADLVAVLAVAFGVSGSLGMGVMQIQAGLHEAVHTPADSTLTSMTILAALVLAYMLSAATSLDKGIKWLSNINMALAGLLMLFVLVAGPTSFLLATFVTTASDYLSNILSLSLRLYPFSDVDDWLGSWTLTYFFWWIAWTPFVGVFIARISRGRTIRQFVTGVLLAPTALSMLWFAVFGGLAFDEELNGRGGIAAAVSEDVTVALFVLFDRLPLSSLLGAVALVLIFVFIVTSADSATFVLGMLTSNGSIDPPTGRKLAWGCALGAMSAGLLLAGSVETVKAVAVLGAVPFVLLLLIQVGALLRVLRSDRHELEASGRGEPARGPSAHDADDEPGGHGDQATAGTRREASP